MNCLKRFYIWKILYILLAIALLNINCKSYQSATKAKVTPITEKELRAVDIDIIDVGVGQCIIIKFPNGKYAIYDAGNFAGKGKTTFAQIKKIVPSIAEIEFLILSHTDGDHIGAAGQIINFYDVKRVISTGLERSMVKEIEPSKSYQRLLKALDNKKDQITYINLRQLDSTIAPGLSFKIGEAKLIFLSGFGTPMEEWKLTDASKKLNAVSIVAKVEYNGSSILFCGDAVGRYDDDPPEVLRASELFLVENAASYLPSEIIVAPHHGANNGSATRLIKAVNPKTVIFSAGHLYDHPRKAAVDRYLEVVSKDDIFRTDRGDDESEGGDFEWDYGRVNRCKDQRGDDDIKVKLYENGTDTTYYLTSKCYCKK